MTGFPEIGIVLESIFPALTPSERWGAARKFTLNFTAQRWMILVGLIALIMMVVLFWWVSYRRAHRARKDADKSFIEFADQRGLSTGECQLLMVVAHRAGLKRSESIFTMGAAFGMGAARVIEEAVEGGQPAEQIDFLKTEIAFLREKLGFAKRRSFSGGAPAASKKLSTRQIPKGKQLYITRRKARALSDIASTVVRNTETELAVKLSSPLKVIFGEVWCVRYYSGASVWEFDTSVVSYDGDIMVLNHSDKVRFVNRRRFLRVPVQMRAMIAEFPFSRPASARAYVSDMEGLEGADLAASSVGPLEVPEFVEAVVTELAGPGLRIESPLDIKAGERILVVLSLDQADSGSSMDGSARDKTPRAEILEDLGEVRHSKQVPNGFSIAVELTGLSDSQVDELIRLTNAASVKAGVGGGGAKPSAGEQAGIAKLAVGQGV